MEYEFKTMNNEPLIQLKCIENVEIHTPKSKEIMNNEFTFSVKMH